MRSHRAGHYSSMDETLAMLALGGGGGGGGGVGYAFVFRPGGSPDKNVFTTWPTLMAAVGMVQGPKLIQVDSSLAPAFVTPGVWNIDGVTFVGQSFATLLTVETGATFTAEIWTLDKIALASTSTAPVWTSPDINSIFTMYDSAITCGAGAAPMIHVTAAGIGQFIANTLSDVGDFTHPVVTIDVGATMPTTIEGGSFLTTNAIVGAGTAIVGLDPDSVMNAQPGLTTLVAATNGQNLIESTNGGALGPAATVTFASGSLTRKRGGDVFVTATMSGTSAGVGGGTITVNLLLDAGIVRQVTIDPGATGEWYASIPWFVPLTDFVAHTFSAQAAASAGTLSVQIGRAAVTASEV